MTRDLFVIGGVYKRLSDNKLYRCVEYCPTLSIDLIYLVEASKDDSENFPYTLYEEPRPFSDLWEVIHTPERTTEGELFS